MSRRFILLSMVAAVSASGASPGAAQEEAKGFSCQFARSTTQSYAKGSFRRRPAKPLSLEIAAIDLAAQAAELVTPDGKGTLRIVRAVGANHFLEVVAEGYLNITTIYARDPRTGNHPAVHSRHFGLFGEPLVSQYVGRCTAK